MTVASKKFLKDYYRWEGQEAHQQELTYASERYGFSCIIRKALVEFLLDKFILSERLSSFLEIGCAEGWFVDYAAKNVALAVGLEISEPKIKRDYGRKRGHYLIADAEHLPFKGKSFDLVLSSEVLEHLLHPKACMGEIFRVGKKYVVVTVPIKVDTHWDRIRRILRPPMEKPFNRPFKGHINEPDLDTLVGWLPSSKWRIIDCFTIGQGWFEKLGSLERTKRVLDFPSVSKVRAILKRVYTRLSMPLERPLFIAISLRRMERNFT